mmetsp:Transcript_1170/g.3323  ORF Transcript_1170/g.3323 Transcript_1170/m.3323 type:complete len:181 (-) Transcript_1170:491-1033(-)
MAVEASAGSMQAVAGGEGVAATVDAAAFGSPRTCWPGAGFGGVAGEASTARAGAGDAKGNHDCAATGAAGSAGAGTVRGSGLPWPCGNPPTVCGVAGCQSAVYCWVLVHKPVPNTCCIDDTSSARALSRCLLELPSWGVSRRLTGSEDVTLEAGVTLLARNSRRTALSQEHGLLDGSASS